jgi:hypothetical protein
VAGTYDGIRKVVNGRLETVYDEPDARRPPDHAGNIMASLMERRFLCFPTATPLTKKYPVATAPSFVLQSRLIIGLNWGVRPNRPTPVELLKGPFMTSRRDLLRLVPVAICVTAAVALFTISSKLEASAPAGGEVATPGTAAMRVAIDPETGALVSGAEAARLADPAADKQAAAELEQMLNRSDAGLQEVHHADGRVSVNLEGRFMSASVARIRADGKVETLCADDTASAEAFLANEPQTDANGWEVR